MDKRYTAQTLQTILEKLFYTSGRTAIHGDRAYRLDKRNGNAWLQYLPLDEYNANRAEYDKSQVGWYALLRLA
jgi:hypothetical protein